MDGSEIIATLEEPVEDRRPRLRNLLAEAPTETLLDAFAGAERPLTRELLADLLGYRGDPAALDALVAALDDPTTGVRSSVADALGKLFVQDVPLSEHAARRAGKAMLRRFEAERDMPVLTTLAVSLGSARYGPAVPALRAALGSEDPTLVRCARDALERIERGPRSMLDGAQIVAALETPTGDRDRLVAELRDVTTTATLVDALARAERPRTRRLALELLGERCDPAGIDALLTVLDDPDPEVRAAVADALEAILLVGNPRDEGAEQRAGAAMLERFEAETVPTVRQRLALALGAAEYRPALPALRAALEGDDPELAAAAEWGLHWFEDSSPPAA